MWDTDHTIGSVSAEIWEGPWGRVTGGAPIRFHCTDIPTTYCPLSGTQLIMYGA